MKHFYTTTACPPCGQQAKIQGGDQWAILDIGAFVGDSALILAEYFPENPIYCFEPNPENFSNMQKTLRLNALDSGKIKLINAAAGAHVSKGSLQGSSITASLSDAEAEYEQVVNITTVDNFVKDNALNVALIKVDVEGHEQQMLEGALETIKGQKPILIMSIYHDYEQFFKIKPFIEDLNLGYSFDFFWGVSGKLNKEIMLLCEVR